MRQTFQDFYLGLDIGTNSVGWALTDMSYQLMRFNRKDTWGVRLFEEGETAENRRKFRTARRRLKRRNARLKLLQELFSEEIAKVDSTFFMKLKESKYHLDERTIKNHYTLFNDEHFSDEDYYDQYPTIFHLRHALMVNPEKKDIRLIYLAIHNILKKRGHFLFEGADIQSIQKLDLVYQHFLKYFNDHFAIRLDENKTNEVETILKDGTLKNTEKVKKLKMLYPVDQKLDGKRLDAAFKLMVGNTGNFKDLFSDARYKDVEQKSINFKEINYEETRDKYAATLNDDIALIDILKNIYDWRILSGILQGSETLSDSMVGRYKAHKTQLKNLKYLIKKYLSPQDYDEVFRNSNSIYANYIGYSHVNGAQLSSGKRITQEVLGKELKKYLDKVQPNKEDVKLYEDLKEAIANKEILPKQRVATNGVIPYQLHRKELVKILENASKHYPLLLEKDEDGWSVMRKIIEMMDFRIPYYVGPLNDYHSDKGGYSWVIRKEKGKVLPWNFEEKIDVKASAEKFITRMTNTCTYLIGEDVLPKESLVYTKFMVLNEINNLRVNGSPLSVELKQEMFEELFKIKKAVTQKMIKDFLKIKKQGRGDEYLITGLDDNPKASLKSWIELKNILGEKINSTTFNALAEDAIKWKCLYGDESKFAQDKLKEKYGEILSYKEIKAISQIKFKGWGRLSKKFLLEISGVNKETGEIFPSIIDALYQTNDNLMELLSAKYTFADEIKKVNEALHGGEDFNTEDFLEELNVSPAAKRAICQTIKIVEEIKKITKKEPKKIFIEMAREKSKKKERKNARKDQLLKIYKGLKNDHLDIKNELEQFDNTRLRQKKLYLYFSQLGRCMYSGEKIDLHQLLHSNIYDIDHIYPQSIVKDDSLDNIVLVKKTCNQTKTNTYPIEESIRENMDSLWQSLMKQGLISQVKYERLKRNKPFSDAELANFIARQLVETRQSTKAVAMLLKKFYPNTEIVYVKAHLITDFRHRFEIIKCRALNNFHHAHDAYLAIVVGNAYNTKFTKNPLNFIKEHKECRAYNLNRLYDYDIVRGSVKAWDKTETIIDVKRNLKRPTVLVTERTFEQSGQLFDATLNKKGGKEGTNLPLNEKMSDLSKYGSYGSIKGKYFFLVEHRDGKKIKKTLEMVPLHIANTIKSREDLLNYASQVLKLNDPKILEEKILYRTKIQVNGHSYIISRKMKKSLGIKNAIELTLKVSQQRILKDISDYLSREEDKRFIKKRNNQETTETAQARFDQEMIEMYDEAIKRLSPGGVYANRVNNPVQFILNHRGDFLELSINEKATTINEIYQLFSRKSGASANLKVFGGSKDAGVQTLGKNFIDKDIQIIDESVTGLFSSKRQV